MCSLPRKTRHRPKAAQSESTKRITVQSINMGFGIEELEDAASISLKMSPAQIDC